MEVLKRHYNSVQTLKAWLCGNDSDGNFSKILNKTTDHEKYAELLTSVYVCEETDPCHLINLASAQHHNQRELVLTTIERIIRKNGYGKNVLAYGFCLMSADPFAHSCGVNVESRYPNSYVNRLFYPAWESLLALIGDSLMVHLLEHTSLFQQTAPTCLLQITGSPLNSLHEVNAQDSNNRSSKVRLNKKQGSGVPDPSEAEMERETSDSIRKCGNHEARNCVPTVGTARTIEYAFKPLHRPTCSYMVDNSVHENANVTDNYEQNIDNLVIETNTKDFKDDKGVENVVKTLVGKRHNRISHRRHEPNTEKLNSKNKGVRLGKLKKLYEDIAESRFTKLKEMSEVYAKCKMKEANIESEPLAASSTNHRQTCLNVRYGDLNRKMEIHSNKRKFGDMVLDNECVISYKDSEQRSGEAKRRCLEYSSSAVLNTECQTVNEGIETVELEFGAPKRCLENSSRDVLKAECEKEGNEYIENDVLEVGNTTVEMDVEDKTCAQDNDGKCGEQMECREVADISSKNKKCRKKKKNKFVKSSELKDPCMSSFCPYDYHLPLPRSSVLFARNPRENLPKSVQLCKVDSTPQGILALYRHIFCETDILSSTKHVRVTSPDLTSTEGTLHCHDKTDRSQSSDEHGCHSNNSNLLSHPSFRNDSIMKNIMHDSCEHEQKITDAGQNNSEISSNFGLRQDCAELTIIEARNVSDDVHCGTLYGETVTGSYKTHKIIPCTKEAQLAKRKQDILASRNTVQCNVSLAPNSTESVDDLVGEGEAYEGSSNSPDYADRDSISGTTCMVPPETRSLRGITGSTCSVPDEARSENDNEKASSERNTIDLDASLHCTLMDNCVNGTSVHVGPMESTRDGLRNDRLSDHSYVNASLEDIPGRCTGKVVELPVASGVLHFLKQFIEKHRRCPYKALLNHHCPVNGRKTTLWGVSYRKRRGLQRKPTGPSMSQLLVDHHHHRKVYLFMRACIVRTLPLELVGTKHNLNILLNSVSKIISLGRYDRFSLGQLMHGIKTREVVWLNVTVSNCAKRHLLAKLLYWLLRHYVFVLLKTCFYITDTAFLRYRMIYYRQATWSKLHILGLNGLIRRKILKLIPERRALEMLQARHSLGVSVLRFLPKQQSLRPIINMASSLTLSSWQTLPVNKQLSDLHSVLTYLKNRNPSLIGHGKLGTNDIYQAWWPFVHRWRNTGSPPLYFVKTDIANCYDSIDQNKLCGIMENLMRIEMQDEEYVIRKYFTLRMKKGCVHRKFHRTIAPMSKFNPDFTSSCRQSADTDKLQHAIFVDKVVYQHETYETLTKLLTTHLCNNLVRIGNQCYIQTSGISQGSVISTLLCSFYYADMERNMFSLDDSELLIRIVDDYMYVTPSHTQAVQFVRTMMKGVPEYNCSINKEKMFVNFDYKVDDGTLLPMISSEWFPWCGVLFNTRTLEVMADFSRYSGFSIKDTMTIELSKTPGNSLKDKNIFSVRQKCHALFTDSIINSEHQILSNLYQTFLLAMCKLHVYIQQLPYKKRTEKNAKYFMGVVKAMACAVKQLVVKYQAGDSMLINSSSDVISWICLKACLVKFGRHHSQYKLLLREVRKCLLQKQRRLNVDELCRLGTVVSPSLPDGFHTFLS